MKGTKGITLIALIITIIVLLILAVAAISAVKDSSIITHAKKAVSSAEMAQIKEEAQLANTEMFLEAKMDSSIIPTKQYFLEKLQTKTFEGRVTRRIGDVLIIDGIYEVSVIDSNFNVEVKEYKGIGANQLLTISYTTQEFKVDGQVQHVNVKLNVKAGMTDTEYKEEKEKYEITLSEKEKVVCQELTRTAESWWTEEGKTPPVITNIEDWIVYNLNYELHVPEDPDDPNNTNARFHTLIDDWYIDEVLLGMYNAEINPNPNQPVTTLNLDILCNIVLEVASKEEFIIQKYDEIVGTPDYLEEYDFNTKNLVLYILKNGKNYTNYGYGIDDVSTTGVDIIISEDRAIIENGTYEVVIKNSAQEVVAYEKIIVNNIVRSEFYAPIDPNVWVTDNNGTILRYGGREKILMIPKYIGEEKITKIKMGSSLMYYTTEEVIIPDTVTSIESFAGSNALRSITIPNSVISIAEDAFAYCTNLRTINYTGSATGSPWGAPNLSE